MRKIYKTLLVLMVFTACQPTKEQYLTQNRIDLHTPDFQFPQKDFKVLGFGAYHGSEKTEDVELRLLHSLTEEGLINYYFPEVDYSTAYFYNQFLQTGDTTLLKELVIFNGYHVAQERTIAVYEKWKKLKVLNDRLPLANQLTVLGAEWVLNYRFVCRHLLELAHGALEELSTWQDFREMVLLDTTSYAIGEPSRAREKLIALVTDYESNQEVYASKLADVEEFAYVLRNVKRTFPDKKDRELLLYENFVSLSKKYELEHKTAFFRIGFFHLEKAPEGPGGYAPFFSRLINNGFCAPEEVISVIGYFTDSQVVWDELYEDGQYSGYTIAGGFGIGDYEKEYFRGIQLLKDARLSDMTLFRLNKPGSPYGAKEPDLIEIVMADEASNGDAVRGMATTDFLDYAVLNSDSKASVPIYEMGRDE